MQRSPMLPKTVYHYTNSFEFLEGLFYKPIQLFATHKDFLNDPSELSGTTRRLQRELKELGKNILDDKALKSQLKEIDHLNIFVKSFSCARNSLPMWTTYAKYDGFAVGFNTRNLINAIVSICEKECALGEFSVLRYKNHSSVSLSFGVCQYKRFQSNDSPWDALLEAFYKHKAYCYEQEFRIALLNPDAYAKEFCKEVDRYRFIGGKPRVPIHLAQDIDINKLIDEIIISPVGDRKLTKLKVDFLCKQNNFDLQKIKVSKIPYQEI